MTQTGFIAAMAAELAFAAYDSPAAVERCQSEWIIVSMWGADREFLSLSRTGVRVHEHDAPPGLQPSCTYLGVLLSRVAALGNETCEYLLMRNRPADIPVGGVFHPTDGFVRLSLGEGAPSLIAHGRFAHAASTLRGLHVMNDVPDPALGAEDAAAWHLTASRRPWIGEFIGEGRSLTRPASIQRAPAIARTPRPIPVMTVPPRTGDGATADLRSAAEPPGHLAADAPTPHTRRRKRPEAQHDVATEAGTSPTR